MIVINLFGGPGSGKSTAAAHVFSRLKTHGVRAELVGEAAKEIIYSGQEVQLENQFLMSALQYKRLLDLKRSGCEVAISDGPLMQQPQYAQHLPYIAELEALVKKVNADFDNKNVFIRRVKPFQAFGRVQKTHEEAAALDVPIFGIGSPFWMIVRGDEAGNAALAAEVLALAKQAC